MVAHQRHALFNLLVAIAGLALFFGLLPWFGLAKAQAGFAALAIAAFGGVFYRRRAGRVVADERDQIIFLRAAQLSLIVFWLLFAGGVFGTYACLIRLDRAVVSTDALPLFVWLGWTLLLLCNSLTLLILYGRS